MTQSVSITSTEDTLALLSLDQLIERFLTCLDEGDQAELWEDNNAAIDSALRYINRASELVSDDPWIWFQIGWLNYSLQPNRNNADIAQSALEQALVLDPENSIVHLAMAFLSHTSGIANFANILVAHGLNITIRGVESDQELSAPALTQVNEGIAKLKNSIDRTQQHLVASRWKELLSTVFYRSERHLVATRIETPWLPVEFYVDELLLRLEELGPAVPEGDRLNFYHAIGVELENVYSEPMGLPWYERAILCKSDDLNDLFLLHTHFGRAIGYTDRDRKESATHLLTAYRYLVQLPNREEWINYWMGDVERLTDWDPGDDLPLFLELIDSALGLVSYSQDGAVLAGAAGAALIKHDRLNEAERYLVQARQWDPQRISVLNLLAFIKLEGRRWSEALEDLREVLKNDPNDGDAQRWVPLLEIAADKTTYNASIDSMLGLMKREFGELHSAQNLMMEELVFHRSLIERVGDVQRQAEFRINRAFDTERAYDDLIDQLHVLVQEGAKIQPAAWHAAYNQIVVDLGKSVFDSLHEDSQHFLQTAEVFFRSGQEAHLTDAAPVSVEYAKVVETELRSRIMKPEFSRGNLGSAIRALDDAASGIGNNAILKRIQQTGLDEDWLKNLVKDLEAVRTKYRNGAAHVERLDWGVLVEFRFLLFQGGLLERLIELGSVLNNANPQNAL